jgi:hypothetical protein
MANFELLLQNFPQETNWSYKVIKNTAPRIQYTNRSERGFTTELTYAVLQKAVMFMYPKIDKTAYKFYIRHIPVIPIIFYYFLSS